MLDVLDWESEEKQTKPIARFSEASLIKALEENGVGRLSTYAAIMSKLTSANMEKEKRLLLSPRWAVNWSAWSSALRRSTRMAGKLIYLR